MTEPCDDATGICHTVVSPDFSSMVDRAQRTGRGYMRYNDGSVYEGEWVGGERCGLGACYFPSGNIYVGSFKDGEMDGEGTMFFGSGDLFTGVFRDSNCHSGLYSSQAKEVRGVWSDGGRVEEYPVGTPDWLQRLHARLFATVLDQVHRHLSGFASNDLPQVRYLPHLFPIDIPAHRSPMDSNPLPFGGSVSRRRDPIPPASATIGVGAASNASFSSMRRLVQISEIGKEEELPSARAPRSTPMAIFSCAAPSAIEYLSGSRFLRYGVAFLFPMLALPHGPFAPLRVTTLDIEREFVVSGATLTREFDTPTVSIYVVTVAFCCHVVALVMVASRVALGGAQEGQLTVAEMAIPCVLWVLFALFGASYNGFYRVAHALERMDRQLTPKLAVFAASVVDARSHVCVYTWDEEGRGKVMNPHYGYRWAIVGVLCGAVISMSAPVTRAVYGHGLFGDSLFERAAAVLSLVATLLLTSTLMYYVSKVTDMQREVNAKMYVLTRLAFLEKRSIVRPSEPLRNAFHFDEDLDAANLFSGFSGWFVTRSVVLYASACANHTARCAAMSIFTGTVFLASVIAIADCWYCVVVDKWSTTSRFGAGHAYGVTVLLLWGVLQTRYLSAVLMTWQEAKRHYYVMETASLYHVVTKGSVHSGDIIRRCKQMAATYDGMPVCFGFRLSPLAVLFIGAVTATGLAALLLELGQAIRSR